MNNTKPPRTIDQLMCHMNDETNRHMLPIREEEKQKLRHIGYFHGYKGYRYYKSPNTILPYKDFNELYAVYDFDSKVKAILYPQIMFLETTIKNYSLEIIMDDSKKSDFHSIYNDLLNEYKKTLYSSKKSLSAYKKSLQKKMRLQDKIHKSIYSNYNKKYDHIVGHYYDKDNDIPIWAIFELISLGEFGNFISCLDEKIKKKISKSIGLNYSYDPQGILLEKFIFALKDLRNAIAHNDVIFDTRFKNGEISNTIIKYITNETEEKEVNFQTITDYIIMISILLSALQCNKESILNLISDFENCCEQLRSSVDISIYHKILSTRNKNKIFCIKNFIKK